MENNDALTTEQQSLRLINEMIMTAKSSMKDDGFLYLFWGWLIFASALLHYGLLHYTQFSYPYAVWLTMPLAGIFSAVYSSRKARREKVRTIFDTFMKYLWMGFIASIIILLIGMSRIGWQNGYPILMILYGLGTFVSGGALKFRPLIIGGIASWLIALLAFFVAFDIQLLLLALSILVSYIIPGHLLKANYQHSHV